MPTFTFKARTSAGEVISGTHSAESESMAAQQLRDQGYWVTELHARPDASAPRPAATLSEKPPLSDFLFGEGHPKDLALFYRQLAAMVNAGMGISRGVELAAEGTHGRLRRALAGVVEQTAQGTPLFKAMESRRELFGRTACALIRVGETAGRLDAALRSSADHFDRRWHLQQLVRRAMVYPVILMIATILIPALPIAVIQGTEAAVRVLVSQALFLLQLAVFYAAFKVIVRFEAPGMVWDTLRFYLPIIGKFTRKTAAARFLRTYADLFDVGVGPIAALDVAADTCGNRYMSRQLLKARPALNRGEPLSTAFASTGMLPRVALQMLATGEVSGHVGELLNKVAEYMESEVETATQSFMRALPVLLWAVVAIPMVMQIIHGATDYASQLNNIMDNEMNP